MKKIGFACMLMASITAVAGFFAGCSSDNGRAPAGSTEVRFWSVGNAQLEQYYKALAEEFNETNDQKIYVSVLNRVQDEHNQAAQQALATGGRTSPDIVATSEAGGYKFWAEKGYLYDITDKVVTVAKEQGIDESAYSRFFYDVSAKSETGADKKLYAAPNAVSPTVLFYNETLFEKAGITVISVSADELEAFNAGEEDAKGKTKSQYGLSVTVKENGYFEADGKKVFNNAIPMSWDECAELAKEIQSSGVADYGFYSEWWFNYGWSVGGDCLEFIPSESSEFIGGYYDFTLMNDVDNAIVADDVESVKINGKEYHGGELVDYADRVDLSSYPETPTADALAEAKDSHELSDETEKLISEGTLIRLPSQRDAFVEFVRLGMPENAEVYDGKKGYGIAPKTATIGEGDGKIRFFMDGKLGMVVDYQYYYALMKEKAVNYKIDIAPLPMYKEYDADGNVKTHGIQAGHSASAGLCISAKSNKKEEAWAFIEFCMNREKGQTLLAETGMFVPLQKDLRTSETYVGSGNLPQNYTVAAEAAEYERAGDWFYLKDNAWIKEWANELNNYVREQKKTLNEFYNGNVYTTTFETLLDASRKNR